VPAVRRKLAEHLLMVKREDAGCGEAAGDGRGVVLLHQLGQQVGEGALRNVGIFLGTLILPLPLV